MHGEACRRGHFRVGAAVEREAPLQLAGGAERLGSDEVVVGFLVVAPAEDEFLVEVAGDDGALGDGIGSGDEADAADLHIVGGSGDAIERAGDCFGSCWVPRVGAAGEGCSGHHHPIDIEAGGVIDAPSAGDIAGDGGGFILPGGAGVYAEVKGVAAVDVEVFDAGAVGSGSIGFNPEA